MAGALSFVLWAAAAQLGADAPPATTPAASSVEAEAPMEAPVPAEPATEEPTPAEPVTSQPRGAFDAMFTLATPDPTAAGLSLRGRVRLALGLWVHVGVGARAGGGPVEVSAPAEAGGSGGRSQPRTAGVREFPFELGLSYRVALGERLELGVRGEVVPLSRRMVITSLEPQHRWLLALRGGAELRIRLADQLGLLVLAGAEGRLGRTEVVFGAERGAFAPLAFYAEIGPTLYF